MQLRARRTDDLYSRWCFVCGTLLLLGCSLLKECDGQPDNCQWTRMDDKQIAGGTMNPANDIATCQKSCLSSDGCKAIDFRDDQAPGQKCFLLYRQEPITPAPGVTHFNLTCSTGTGGVCSWSVRMNTRIVGGFATPELSLKDCLISCQTATDCVGVDWNLDKGSTTQCFLHIPSGDAPHPTNDHVDHYDLVKDCIGIVGVCAWLPPKKNTRILGGRVTGALNLKACQEACQSADGCVGFDWDWDKQPTDQCFLHFGDVGEQPTTDNVDHWNLIGNCKG